MTPERKKAIRRELDTLHGYTQEAQLKTAVSFCEELLHALDERDDLLIQAATALLKSNVLLNQQ